MSKKRMAAMTIGVWLDGLAGMGPEWLGKMGSRLSLDFPLGVERADLMGDERPVAARLLVDGSLEEVEAFFGSCGWKEGHADLGEALLSEEKRARWVGESCGIGLAERSERLKGIKEEEWRRIGKALGTAFARMGGEIARSAWLATLEKMDEWLGEEENGAEASMGRGAMESELIWAIGDSGVAEGVCAGVLGSPRRILGRDGIIELAKESEVWKAAALKESPNGFASTLVRDAIWMLDGPGLLKGRACEAAARMLEKLEGAGLATKEEMDRLGAAATGGDRGPLTLRDLEITGKELSLLKKNTALVGFFEKRAMGGMEASRKGEKKGGL